MPKFMAKALMGLIEIFRSAFAIKSLKGFLWQTQMTLRCVGKPCILSTQKNAPIKPPAFQLYFAR